MHDEIKNNSTEPGNEDSVLTDIAGTGVLDNESFWQSGEEESLRRWGFQYAIKERNRDLPSAGDFLKEFRNRKSEEITRWQVVYDSIQSRYREKIAAAKKEIGDIEEGLLPADPTKKTLETRKEELESQMKDYCLRVIEARKKMLLDKKDMVGKFMDDAENQVKNALALEKLVYDQVKDRNSEQFKDSKDRLDANVASWTEKRNRLSERVNEVQLRMKLINADGVNPSAAFVLIGIGSSVAAAAGYFFSIFTSSTGLGNNDAFFFLLKGFLKLGNNTGTGLLAKLLLLVLFVVLIGLISYVCFRIFRRFFDNKKSARQENMRVDGYNRVLKENSGLSAEVRGGSWFSLWLQVSPLVIIVGVLVLLLALNTTTADEVNSLNSSLEGTLAGTTIALGLGGMLTLYIMKVVEPRLIRKHTEGKSGAGWLKHNWELAACICAFILLTAAVIWLPMKDTKFTARSTNAVAISEFIVVAMLSAFPFAYGMRFRGLVAVDRYLQREIERLDYIVAYSKTPEKPDVNDHYNKVSAYVSTVLEAVQIKALWLQQAGSSKIEAFQPSQRQQKPEKNALFPRIFDHIRNSWRDLFNSGNDTAHMAVHRLISLTDWERGLFPDIAEEINLLGTEFLEIETEHKKVKQQLDALEGEYSASAEERAEKIVKLQKEVETLLTYGEKAEVSRIKKWAKIESMSVRAEAAVLDGFHLGAWYRENQMGPVDNYYWNEASSKSTAITPVIKLLENGNR
jgi:hypothetical protein